MAMYGSSHIVAGLSCTRRTVRQRWCSKEWAMVVARMERVMAVMVMAVMVMAVMMMAVMVMAMMVMAMMVSLQCHGERRRGDDQVMGGRTRDAARKARRPRRA